MNTARLLSLLPCLLLAASTALGQPGKAFRIDSLQCRRISCELREGLQAGLTTLEAEGVFRGLQAVRMQVLKHGSTEPEFDRRIGVMSNGKVTVSVPAYRLPDGVYRVVLTSGNSATVVADASFRKTSAAFSGDRDSQPQAPRVGPGLVGEWRGINKTAGMVVISADGTYSFNGAAGRYRASGNQVVFSGPLAAWDNGRATVKDGVIEFYWTNREGWKQWFTFAKVK